MLMYRDNNNLILDYTYIHMIQISTRKSLRLKVKGILNYIAPANRLFF